MPGASASRPDLPENPLTAKAILASCLLLTISCGGGGSGEGFVTERSADIMYDCMQTIICEIQRNTPRLGNDPVADCVDFATELLKEDEMVRLSFDGNFGRCANLMSCLYLDCVVGEGDGRTYGEMQIDKIIHDCQSTITCDLMEGRLVGEFPERDCKVINVKKLNNNFDQPTRVAYETQYAQCEALFGCEFVTCFAPF